jgi:hypothetical protein
MKWTLEISFLHHYPMTHLPSRLLIGLFSIRGGNAMKEKDAMKENNVTGESGAVKENGIVEEKNKGAESLIGIALLGGVIFDYLFYGKTAGVSYFIAVLLFYALFFWRLRDRIDYAYSFGWVLVVPILLLSLTYAVYSNELFYFLNGIAVPFLIAVQTSLVTRNTAYQWYDIRIIGDAFRRIFPQSLRYAVVPFRIGKARIRKQVKEKQYKVISKIGLGLLISLPLLFVVITLLASADKMFAQSLHMIPGWFNGVPVGELAIRLFLILMITVYLFSYIWGLMHRANGSDNLTVSAISHEPRRSFTLDSTVTLTVLVVVNAVYILFSIIQFTYLFGSGDGVLPNGTTYAEHARSGFGELVVVTLINFSILLSVINLVVKENPLIHRSIQVLLSLLIGSTLVMLCSAYARLSWYEQAYGYTYTRILVHAFLIFLFILFLLAIYKIWREHTPLLKPYILIAMAAYMVINYMNIDQIITRSNIERYEQSGKIDLSYLSRLSYDAVPELAVLSKSPNPPEGIEQSLDRMERRLDKERPWQSFNLSKYRAEKLLNE